MENPNSLGNLLAYGAIIVFLVLVALFVLRTLMLPLGVIVLSAVRNRRTNETAPDITTSEPPSASSVPPTAE